METKPVFSQLGVDRCPRICPQPAHTAPTGQATCFAGVASLPGSQNRTQGQVCIYFHFPPAFPGGKLPSITPARECRWTEENILPNGVFSCKSFSYFFSRFPSPFFKICFAKPFLCFMRLNFCVEGLPAPWVNKRPGLLRPSHKHSFFCHVLVKVHQDAGRMGTGSGAFRGDKAKSSSSSSSVISPAPLPSA